MRNVIKRLDLDLGDIVMLVCVATLILGMIFYGPGPA